MGTYRFFYWPAFLDSVGVAYVLRGANVAAGHVNIRCPFCGDADPSHHMGLRVLDGAYACYRNSTHRGRSPVRLVARILGCSYKEAQEVVAEAGDLPRTVDLGDLKKRLAGKQNLVRKDRYEWPEEVRLITSEPWHSPTTAPFLQYLTSRGFDDPFALAGYYGLRYARTGHYRWRVVFPVTDASGQVHGFQARAIRKRMQPRYDSDGPVHKQVFNAQLKSGGVLVITEGPLDALKIDVAGRQMGVRSIAAMGLNVSKARVEAIYDVLDLSEKDWTVYIALDAAAIGEAVRLKEQLALVNARIARIPDGFDDPGEMPLGAAAEFCKKLLNRACRERRSL